MSGPLAAAAWTDLDADASSRPSCRLQEYKSRYLVLHDAVLKTYANEKVLLARGRQLKQVRVVRFVLAAAPTERAVLRDRL